MNAISPIRMNPVMSRPNQRPQNLSAQNQPDKGPLFGGPNCCGGKHDHEHSHDHAGHEHTHQPNTATTQPPSSAQATQPVAPAPATEPQPATKQQPAASKDPERKWYQKIGDWFKNLFQTIKDDLIALKDKIKSWFSKKPDKA